MGRHRWSPYPLAESMPGETDALEMDAPETDAPPWTLHRGWLAAEDAKHWTTLMTEKIAWEQPVVKVYGRRHPVPRMAVFLANKGVQYRYSGTTHSGEGWPDWFTPLLTSINDACRSRFNGCLLNLYRHGDDRMGWHADDEPEIDQTQPIGSLSLGASRDFHLRHRVKRDHRIALTLSDGDLLIMHPGCQQNWMHSVPQRRRISTPRINLTFRRFQPR